MKKIVYSLFAGLVVSAGLASCSSDEPAVGVSNGEINVIRAPKVIAYSGTPDNLLSTVSRSANVNGNQWYETWDRPTNVTQEEIEKVLEAVKEPRVGAVNDITIEWENFWVQQVYKGQTSYSDHYNNDRGLGSDLMNQLSVWNDNVEVWWPEHTFGGYEDVNNFNRGDNQTTYTDDETKEQFVGTTLMTNMSGGNAANQFAYKNSADGGKYYCDYIIVEVDGEYYVCFDFYADNRDNPTATANKDHYIDRDWIFNDWIVKISPAYHKGETPEKPAQPGDDFCDECGHAHSDGTVCDECGEGTTCHPSTQPEQPEQPEQPAQPGDVYPAGKNEVEVNLTPMERNGGELESHLSIHVRHATDVEIFIPVPAEYYCEADDMAIVQIHDKNHSVHGGPYTTTYVLEDKEDGPFTVTLNVEYVEDGIRIWTEGITQDVIDFCYKHYGDGITFEVWNYFNDGLGFEGLKDLLNQATVRFLDDLPDAYINAFTEEGGMRNDDDCTVSIVDDQSGYFEDAVQGEHLNGSRYNDIYKNKNAD